VANSAVTILSLGLSLLFAVYATRYYAYSIVTLRNWKPVDPPPEEAAFVTILLPIYNEPARLINRLLNACVGTEFPRYEIIVADDSSDPETLRAYNAWKDNPRVKIVHRDTREGFKGGAMNNALRYADPRWTHAVIFDADYVPMPDTVFQLLSRFEDEKVAAVQGYQHHDLNDSETWVTRGARVNYTAWQLTDFPARSVLKTFIPLGGSAMIVRRKVLEEVEMFSPTIAEDWDLSVKIHLKGYRVLYDDSIRVSAECPSRLRQWLRQQMRWAEGTTILFRKYCWKVLKSPNMGVQAKMNYLMDVSIYLQAVPMLLVSIVLASRVFWPSLTAAALPYYFALPLLVYLGAVPFTSGAIGFRRDGATRKLYWLPLGLLLTYIAMPFAAYSAFKGFVLNRGTFTVTKKTGVESKVAEPVELVR